MTVCNLLMAKNKLYKDPLYREVIRHYPYIKDKKLNPDFTAYIDSLIGRRGKTRQAVLNSLIYDLTELNNELLKISPNIREVNVMALDPLLECKKLLNNR